MRRGLLPIILATLIMLTLIGCTPPVAKSPSGKPTTSQATIYVVHAAEIKSSVGQWNEAPSGRAYLLVTVRILNNGYESFSTSPFYFAAVVGNVKYSPTYLLMDYYLESVDLLNGGETTGYIAFEVPISELEKNNYKYSLVYEPFLMEYDVVFQSGKLKSDD